MIKRLFTVAELKDILVTLDRLGVDSSALAATHIIVDLNEKAGNQVDMALREIEHRRNVVGQYGTPDYTEIS